MRMIRSVLTLVMFAVFVTFPTIASAILPGGDMQVPEPTTLLLLGAGAAGLGGYALLRKKFKK